MHSEQLHFWQHEHGFGQEHRRPGERRTFIVIALTVFMMAVEVAAGIVFGSMALLADGLHMASHAVALGVTAIAYIYARRHAHDERFSFSTGKVNALGGYTGAIMLAVFALIMAWESLLRLHHPVQILYNQAILVAVIGLLVNGFCAFILDTDRGHDHADKLHDEVHHHDHNLKSAYLHVLTDALTSVLAIIALLAAKYFNATWMDPAMGVAGSILVARWSYGLLNASGSVLLDRQGPQSLTDNIRSSVERDGDSRISDLHVWSIGPGIYASEITIVAHNPATPDTYRERILKDARLEHITIEIHQCPETA